MRKTAFLLFALALPVCAAKQRATRPFPAPAPQAGPTFSKEVVRIFQQHCQSCHSPNNVAPFSLVDYSDAKPYAPLIKFMTQSKQMPPWKPSDGCGDFADKRSMSKDEIDTIAQWVQNGAPEGNRADLPKPLDFSSDWRLGQPDLVLENIESYTPPTNGDTYRCFTVPTSLGKNAYVRAVDTKPGDRETVHHVIAFIDTTGASKKLDDAEPGPGYTCFGDPGFSAAGTLGGWAPGSPPLEMPDNVGFELPKDARVVLQVHYHPHDGAPAADRTQFGVYLAKQTPKNIMRILPIINTEFKIPAGDANYRVDAQFPLQTPFPIKLWLIAPHMHYLGKKMKVEVTLPGGAKQCLIDIQDWDFHWQGAYRYKEPVTIPAGSALSLTAYYDNSASNPRQPNDPPKTVGWGEATTDEMCIAFLGVTIE